MKLHFLRQTVNHIGCVTSKRFASRLARPGKTWQDRQDWHDRQDLQDWQDWHRPARTGKTYQVQAVPEKQAGTGKDQPDQQRPADNGKTDKVIIRIECAN